ncbi:MAG TPA: hypothetical protein VNR00_20295 [Opitutus sp.]|nr:hypothetical protein [Opitutus sp.]
MSTKTEPGVVVTMSPDCTSATIWLMGATPPAAASSNRPRRRPR